MMPEITLTSTLESTGESTDHAINPNDLISVTLPFQPAIVNHEHVKRLVAKDWRHRETGWYDKEHALLTQLGQQVPSHQWLIDEMRLLLYAVFVKEAEVRRRGKLLSSSRKRFADQYAKFHGKWGRHPALPSIELSTESPLGPDEYLRCIRTSSYFELRPVISAFVSDN